MTRPTGGWRGWPLLISAALRAYPRAFREHFGDEMRRDFLRRPGVRHLAAIAAGGLAERAAAVARFFWSPGHVPHLYKPSGKHMIFWDSVRSDIRFTIRTAVREPLYTGLAVLLLALGIGANTAIFTVVYDVMMRPLPYRSAGDLVMVWSNDTNGHRPRNPISPADFIDLREQSRAVLSLEGYFAFVTNSQLMVGGYSEVARTASVTPGLFPLLGRDAASGRRLSSADGADRIVISDGFWRRQFGSDPAIVGREFQLDGRPVTVVGVMPADFVFPYKGMLGPTGFTQSLDVDIWTPLPLNDARMADKSGRPLRDVRFLGAIGRLQPGVQIERVRPAIADIAARLARAYPDADNGWTTTVVPLHEQVVGDVRPALLLLAAGVVLILAMACVNVANLVFARAVARRKELAVRAALGAGRRRLAAQALTESTLIALAGAAVALLFTAGGVRALVAMAPGDLPRLREVHPDASVLAVSLALAVTAGIAVGILPALFAGRTDVRTALQDAARGSVGSRASHRVRSGLVVAEIALALVLTVAAGLLLRSFGRLLDVDPGFRVDDVLTFELNLPARLATADARRAFYALLFERLDALPGVISTGGTTRIPLGSTNSTTTVQVEGRAVPASEQPTVDFRRAMHDYFSTMGIPVLRGRRFTIADGPASPAVAVINQTMAQRLFANEDPIGRRVRIGPNASGPWTTIVGVIGDVHHSRIDADPEPELYISSIQNPPVAPFIALRTTGNPADLAEVVRSTARALDPTLLVYDIRTMAQIRSEAVAERRFLLLLIGLFGALAIVLASVGVYGVITLVVSERTQEIGVRLALGAEPWRVLRMIVGDAIRLALAGAGIGLVLAAALSPLIRAQLFGVRPLDPLTFTVTAIGLVTVAAIAAVVPGWRAMRIDPMQAINSL